MPSIPPGLGMERVTFNSGFGVSQVKTGFESRQIILGNVPASVIPAKVTATLAPFGEVSTVTLAESTQDGSFKAYRVTFMRAESAAEAATALNDAELFDVRVTARLAANKTTAIGGGKLSDGDVFIELPTARQIGYVGYETLAEAQKAMALAAKKELRGMRVVARVYEGIPTVGTINVRYECLPADATVKDLARFGKYESYMLDRPKYRSIPGAIHGLRRMLEEHGEVTVNALPPPYGKFFCVWAHFTDSNAAVAATEALHRYNPHFVGKQRIFARHIKSIAYNLPGDAFEALAYDINLLRSYCQDDAGTSISVFDRRSAQAPMAPVLVKLLSQNMASLSKLKASFDRLLRGEKVTENGQIVWNDFFGSRAGALFLDELERVHEKVKINRDPRRRTLALFGPDPARSRAREKILARAKLLKAQRKHRIPIAPHFIGVFMSEDLPKLQKELGHENVWFDLTNKLLVVCGDEDVKKVAQVAVLHAGQRGRRTASRDDTSCPVCFDAPSPPITLSCGHQWCKGCLTGYLNASVDNKAFPLTCLGDGAKCALRIPLAVAQQLLSTNEFDAIVNASFLAHIQARPDEFHYCPTPDCPQVYRKTARETVLQCPSCLVRICPHCDTEYHESGSCQDRNAEDEQLFEEWKHGRDVKDCPSCKVPIERMAGCNHMTCISCKTHICWACLATFPTSQEVYEHMRGIHGGIGL
ncbi:hypothetical protein C8Q80DRAFT_1220161 [Daedaleopsis nitida]|nr:hypothetical protein C8Q80DRAFT_1220161 [Daedaleopsis nitida]